METRSSGTEGGTRSGTPWAPLQLSGASWETVSTWTAAEGQGQSYKREEHQDVEVVRGLMVHGLSCLKERHQECEMGFS